MSQKITYENKVALNENPSIADINKVKDTDMNEIKEVVNSNADVLDTKTQIFQGNTPPEDPEDGALWVDTNDNVLKKYNLSKNQWEIISGQITGDTLPIGSIMPYTSKTTPSNWLPCNGQAVSRTTYADLFAIIGTQYGAGDGSTTFNVPDLNDYKVPIGYDRFEEQSNRMNLGTTGGEETHKLTINEMPKHSHTVYRSTETGSFYGLTGISPSQTTQYVVNTTEAGNSEAHNNMPPYVTTNYIIKAFQSSGVVAQVSNTKSDSTTDTYSCDYINELNNYYVDEQIVGYLGNSDTAVYRKFVVDNQNDGEAMITPATNLLGASGMVYLGGSWRLFPYSETFQGQEYIASLEFDGATLSIKGKFIQGGQSLNNVPLRLVVYYTKK